MIAKLTHEERDAMEAGREMDALVAELVMELCPHFLVFDVRKDDDDFDDYITWTCKHCEQEYRGLAYGKGYNHPQLLHFSTDILAAWQVVEKMTKLPLTIEDARLPFRILFEDADLWAMTASEAAEAISRIALTAVTND